MTIRHFEKILHIFQKWFQEPLATLKLTSEENETTLQGMKRLIPHQDHNNKTVQVTLDFDPVLPMETEDTSIKHCTKYLLHIISTQLKRYY